jgi:hypothetical protein
VFPVVDSLADELPWAHNHISRYAACRKHRFTVKERCAHAQWFSPVPFARSVDVIKHVFVTSKCKAAVWVGNVQAS